MLGAGRSKGGTPLVPRWFAFVCGGNYRQKGGGYGWRPSIFRLTHRYFNESWFKTYGMKGYWEFVATMP